MSAACPERRIRDDPVRSSAGVKCASERDLHRFTYNWVYAHPKKEDHSAPSLHELGICHVHPFPDVLCDVPHSYAKYDPFSKTRLDSYSLFLHTDLPHDPGGIDCAVGFTYALFSADGPGAGTPTIGPLDPPLVALRLYHRCSDL